MKRGDQVTAIMLYRPRRGVTWRVLRARVMLTTNAPLSHEPVFIAAGEGNNRRVFYRLRDEGVTWIRGHHTSDSDEAKALLAAHALIAR